MLRAFRERTNLRTIILSVSLAVVGVIMFSISRLNFFDKYPEWQALVRDFGSLIIASVAVAVIWELFSKRAFMSELLTTTQLADQIQDAGLIRISRKWHGEIDWTSLFRRSDEIEIFFMYGRTWRNINRAELQNFARKENTTATIILPDIENISLITEIARSVDSSPEELISRINEAVKEFVAIFDIEGCAKTRLVILATSTFPVYSYYRFGNIVIVTFYSHDKIKKEVPTFVFEKGGSLFDFFEKDFHGLIENTSCRKIYPAL